MAQVSRGLLDTSVLIALQEDPLLAGALPEELTISVVSLAELHYGVLVAKDEMTRKERLRRLGAFEAAFQPVIIDSAIARAYASVAHAVKLFGRKPRARTMDLWIAATALALQLPLFTRNPGDFEGLEGLITVRIV